MLILLIMYFTQMCVHACTWAAPAAVHRYLTHKLPEKTPHLSNLQQAKQGGSRLCAGGLIESAAKTHSQFPNCLLNTASNKPCCPTVPCHLCLLRVQLCLLLSHTFRLYPKACISWPSSQGGFLFQWQHTGTG